MNQDYLQQDFQRTKSSLKSPLITSQPDFDAINEHISTPHSDRLEQPKTLNLTAPSGIDLEGSQTDMQRHASEKREGLNSFVHQKDDLKAHFLFYTSNFESNVLAQPTPGLLRPSNPQKESGYEKPAEIVDNGFSIELPLLNDAGNEEESRIQRTNQSIGGANSGSDNNIQTLEDQSPVNTNINSSESPALDLYSSLKNIFYTTHGFKLLVSILGLFLLSMVSIRFIEQKGSYNHLFSVLYILELLFLLEQVLIVLKAYGSNRPNYTAILCGEIFYYINDIIAIILLTITVHLSHLNTTGAAQSLPYFFIGLYTIYCGCSRLPVEEKSKRVLFIGQALGILLKADLKFPLSWNLILSFGWILLTSMFLKLFEFLIQVLIAFSGNSANILSKSAKAVVLTGITLLGFNLSGLMVLLMVLCGLLDGDTNLISICKLWLAICKFLNFFILLFVIVFWKPLLEFLIKSPELFHYREHRAAKAKDFIIVKQEVYVKRISPTYYKILEENITFNNDDDLEAGNKVKYQEIKEDEEIQSNKNDDNQEGEGDMCYICCGKTADGVIVDCGHGGICYDCLTNYVKIKDECMECRREVTRIVRIESVFGKEGVLKSNEICKVIKS